MPADIEALRSLPNPEDEPTLKIERVAKILGVSRGAAYAAAQMGEIPTIRIGKRLLVPTAALRRLVELDDAPHTSTTFDTRATNARRTQ